MAGTAKRSMRIARSFHRRAYKQTVKRAKASLKMALKLSERAVDIATTPDELADATAPRDEIATVLQVVKRTGGWAGKTAGEWLALRNSRSRRLGEFTGSGVSFGATR